LTIPTLAAFSQCTQSSLTKDILTDHSPRTSPNAAAVADEATAAANATEEEEEEAAQAPAPGPQQPPVKITKKSPKPTKPSNATTTP